ncbi:hypothetical protein [Mycobacteroides abscessus]|uniref:hypothetical protein n=1 Tax=Mycobacteroides abscessus TaxID=36809 RepID=UPI000928ECB7|nr:hypothetical protein [Mycobacteroides abscessus]SIC20043.1 Uncharacterised protein [Mycobacteroides abscessus subsp. abscessus]
MPTLAATAPSYAPDGSRGYHLAMTADGPASGWIYVADNGHAVYATIDRAPWRSVGNVAAPADLTPAWITENTDAILRQF